MIRLLVVAIICALASVASAQQPVRIYVLDSGVRITHQEFGGRASHGPSFVAGGPDDCSGHGTHVAALAAGASVGLATTSTILSVRVLDCALVGTKQATLAAVQWVTQHYLSYGGPAVALATFNAGPTPWSDDDLDQLIESSAGTGLTWVLAAGNSGDWVFNYTPARVERAITVAASDDSYARPSWSNFGPQVDVFARGVNVTSASYESDTAYRVASGTSMAAGRATGAAAVILKNYPWAPPDHVRNVLRSQFALPLMPNPGPGTTSLVMP